MGHFVALFDACVFYPAPLRDLLIRVSLTDLFQAKWTSRIDEEWISALLRNRPKIQRERLERTKELMHRAVPDCLVAGYEPLIEGLTLPDPGDRHVLAAAIHAQADVIVTLNLRHFPDSAVAPHNIEVLHPDVFIHRLIGLDRAAVCRAVRQQRLALTNPPCSVQSLLERLLALGLASTVSELDPMEELL